jgi:hypothetical protein
MEEFAFMCLGCVHYHFTSSERDTCDAFPSGIPEAIIGGAPHVEPWLGDNGVSFEPDELSGDLVHSYLSAWYTVEGSD